VVVGSVTRRVAFGGWSGLVVIHLDVVEDVGILAADVVFFLRRGVCCHVAIDGVDRGVTGGLLPPLVLLVVWVKDGSRCLRVSGFL
jgi:hypothetical protein